MNANDLFDALRGIDPKYINEAGADLIGKNEEPAKIIPIEGRSKKNAFRKAVLIALPSVAAILIIVGVAIPAIMRVTKSESASAPMSEAASESYGSDNAPADNAEEAQYEAAAEPSVNDSDESAMAESEALSDYTYKKDADREAEDTSAKGEESIIIEETDIIATYDNRILTVSITDQKEALKNKEFMIKKADDVTDQCLVQGKLSDVASDYAPLTLDLKSFDLAEGSYVLTIDETEIPFTVSD